MCAIIKLYVNYNFFLTRSKDIYEVRLQWSVAQPKQLSNSA